MEWWECVSKCSLSQVRLAGITSCNGANQSIFSFIFHRIAFVAAGTALIFEEVKDMQGTGSRHGTASAHEGALTTAKSVGPVLVGDVSGSHGGRVHSNLQRTLSTSSMAHGSMSKHG